MIKIKKLSYPPVNMGISFMLTIFIILCMVIFSVLSLSTVIKDRTYTQKNADRTLAYYNANNQAEEHLAQIDSILCTASTYDTCLKELESLDYISFSTNDKSSNISLTYSVPINETEILKVVLDINPDSRERYTILTWQQISLSEWENKSSLSVYENN